MQGVSPVRIIGKALTLFAVNNLVFADELQPPQGPLLPYAISSS
jgi:hypothetical protein